MQERVQGYTDAVLEVLGARDVTAVAGELGSFAALLAGSAVLHMALTNPNMPAPTRRTIVQELLAKKVSAPTIDLLVFAVQSRPGGDYAEEVDGIAAAAAAKRDGKVVLDEGPLGRAAATERLEGYATAVLAPVRKERELGEIEDELFRFMRIVEGNDALCDALTGNETPVAARQGLVRDLLAGRASPGSVRLATYAVRTGRARDYPFLLEGLVRRVAQEASRRVADVRSAVEMTPAQRGRLAAALTTFTGYPVEVRVTPEPGLLGGFVASIGDFVVDASLRHRLDQVREHLFAPPSASAGATSPGLGLQ